MKKLRIGLSYWGFCQRWEDANTANTPDGHRLPRPLLVKELQKAGHEVIFLQQEREPTGTVWPLPNFPDADLARSSLPPLDALFLEWRWPTHKNSLDPAKDDWGADPLAPGLEPDWHRQKELVRHYTQNGVPTWIHDLDYKMRECDYLHLGGKYRDILDEGVGLKGPDNVVILDSALKPVLDRGSFRVRSFPNYASYDPKLRAAFRRFFGPGKRFRHDYGYVGNNYERDDQFSQYYHYPAEALRALGVQTVAYGNWTERSPERKDPATIISRYTPISFPGRLGWTDSMRRMADFLAVTHIGKSGPYAQGHLVTIRYHEAALSGVPAMVPKEYRYSDILGSDWAVSDAEDVLDRIKHVFRLDERERAELVERQLKSMIRKAEDLNTSVEVEKLVPMILKEFF